MFAWFSGSSARGNEEGSVCLVFCFFGWVPKKTEACKAGLFFLGLRIGDFAASFAYKPLYINLYSISRAQ